MAEQAETIAASLVDLFNILHDGVLLEVSAKRFRVEIAYLANKAGWSEDWLDIEWETPQLWTWTPWEQPDSGPVEADILNAVFEDGVVRVHCGKHDSSVGGSVSFETLQAPSLSSSAGPLSLEELGELCYPSPHPSLRRYPPAMRSPLVLFTTRKG